MTWPPELDATLTAVRDHLTALTPGDPIGAYLYGSGATPAGLGPHSDVDILILTRRSLTPAERRAWVQLLLRISGWSGHAKAFPADHRPGVSTRRPVDLTSIVLHDLAGWPLPPLRDFQYGEWARADLIANPSPEPQRDPDVVSVLATAHHRHQVLSGAILDEDTRPPREVLDAAILAAVPDLLAEIDGDETNSLLTLARMLITLHIGEIVSKDVAAERVTAIVELAAAQSQILMHAAADYRGEVSPDRSQSSDTVTNLGHVLAEHAYSMHGR